MNLNKIMDVLSEVGSISWAICVLAHVGVALAEGISNIYFNRR